MAYLHAEADCSCPLFQTGESRPDASSSCFTNLHASPRRKERVQFDKVRVLTRVSPRASLMVIVDHRADSQALLRLGQGPCRSYWVSRTLIPSEPRLILYSVAQKVIVGVYPGVTTVELDVSTLPVVLVTAFLSLLVRTLLRKLRHTSPRSTPTTLSSPRVSPCLICTRRRRRTFPL